MKMNSFLGKQILSLIRDGDYAHPGEEVAIQRVFQNISPDLNRKILDVGCGRGGTAFYVQSQGWGKVTGIDIDRESIDYARANYPNLTFLASDILLLTQQLQQEFDLLYCFNSFYAFPEQDAALRELRKLAKPEAKLIIFDYWDYGNYLNAPITEEGIAFIPHPIHAQSIGKTLLETGWSLTQMTDISTDYKCWYQKFIEKINLKRQAIIELGGEEAFHRVYSLYARLLSVIQAKQLGGVIIEAQATPNYSLSIV